MERFFIFGNNNTWYDWQLYLTSKSVPAAEPKLHNVELDGADGTLDLTEALTNEVKYNDRKITASFWTNNGTRKEREALIRHITASLHGKKIKIIEPDDPTHYFRGRIKIMSQKNITPYTEFTVEATCEPWRYAIEDTMRCVEVNSLMPIDIVVNNNGVKKLIPIITVTGAVTIIYDGQIVTLTDGDYKLPHIKLYQGINVISATGNGCVIFTYTEADL